MKDLVFILNEDWIPIEHHLKKHPNYYINKNDYIIYYAGGRGKRRKREPYIVNPTLMKNGYYKISLDGENYYLHRLIGEIFIPNPEDKPELDHIDGNPQNNSISNLRWATHKENLNNPVSVQREIDSHKGLPSNIKGRKKIWVDKNNKIYRMI